ncbi:MAG: winged helix-turn-helix transcriptional regulator [Candidatus Aenigmarchaeota archaeon]|nr:winged helix-turn-helix transcriptional regulator [Candidatus Aenigmarchaeota archaeon]
MSKSGRAIYTVLKDVGPVSYSELLEHTKIPKRTLSYALSMLKEKGLITESQTFVDMRNRIYALN